MNIKKVMSIVLSTTLIAGIVPVNIAYASENKSIITEFEHFLRFGYFFISLFSFIERECEKLKVFVEFIS